MILAWADVTGIAGKNSEPEYLRKTLMDYSKALAEVKLAIRNRYEISYIKNTLIILLKYGADKKTINALYVSGSENEITQLQIDIG